MPETVKLIMGRMMLTVEYRARQVRDAVSTELIVHIIILDLGKVPRRVLYLKRLCYLEIHSDGQTRQSNFASNSSSPRSQKL
jgi:hypothetical protein